MFVKHCPHCLKKVPLRKRLKKRCPFCFKPFRRRSGIADRGTVGQFLEDRSAAFWFFNLAVILVLLGMILQLSGYSALIQFVHERPIWFLISLGYASIVIAVIGHIYFPLLIGAPKILRRERAVIRQYKGLTTAGLLLGIPFSMLFTGVNGVFTMFPATAFLMFIPLILLWGYQSLTLSEESYEDERVWSFYQELGVMDRLEHRHYGYMVLIGLPLCALLYYYFLTHPWLANAIMDSYREGHIRMLIDAWQRVHAPGNVGLK
jgi:hypothetical protein